MTPPESTAELPEIVGKGVARLKIADIDKAINKYERKKEARCAASPDEIAAKNDLRKLLVAHAGELPTNKDGQRFYRYEDVDYILEEKLKRRNVDGDDEDGEASLGLEEGATGKPVKAKAKK